jgi:hypothetical protein
VLGELDASDHDLLYYLFIYLFLPWFKRTFYAAMGRRHEYSERAFSGISERSV